MQIKDGNLRGRVGTDLGIPKRERPEWNIGVQKKLGKDLDTEVAALCGLMDQIAAYLRRRPLAGAPGAVWVRTQNEPVYAPEHLAEQRVFTSVLIANANRDPKKGRPFKPSDFDPYARQDRRSARTADKQSLAILREALEAQKGNEHGR